MEERILTPQQEAFLAYYTDPKSNTFGNALQSAIKAGYSNEYANNITSLMPDWLSENIGRLKMLHKAEKNLDKALDFDDEDPNKLKIKYDVSKFAAERLGKRIYSTRTEMTGADGKPLITLSKEEQKEVDEVLNKNNI